MTLPGYPWIVGHRGAAGEAPENTLASFARAVAEGADMIELDVQLTSDGVLAVMHDFDLERLAGLTLRPERCSWSSLAGVELGSPPASPPHRIPRLEQVLDALPAGFPVNVELKRETADRSRLAQAAAEAAGRPNTVISSFDWALLAQVRRRAPGARLAPLAGDDGEPAELFGAARELSAVAVHVSVNLARRILGGRQAPALPVLGYTVNDPATGAYLLDSGASGLFSDHPGPLREALGLSPRQSIRMPCSSP